MSDEDEKVKTRPKKKEKNILTYMESTSENKSPKSLLYESIIQNRKIKVWTRSHSYVRSICIGYLIAFDRYWNLAMIDVDEIYKLPIVSNKNNDQEKDSVDDEADGCSSVDNSSIDFNKIDKSKLFLLNKNIIKDSTSSNSVADLDQNTLCDIKGKKYKICYRHINQLLIRGDNVVIISYAD